MAEHIDNIIGIDNTESIAHFWPQSHNVVDVLSAAPNRRDHSLSTIQTCCHSLATTPILIHDTSPHRNRVQKLNDGTYASY